MKKIVISVCLVVVFFGWYNLSSAGCSNGMLLPQGAKVSRVIDKNGNVTVTVTGAVMKTLHHYNYEKDISIEAKDGSTAAFNAYQGLGFNFTFTHPECKNNPFVLLTPEMMSEAKAMGRKPYFVGEGIGVDCSRPDRSCSFIVVAD